VRVRACVSANGLLVFFVVVRGFSGFIALSLYLNVCRGIYVFPYRSNCLFTSLLSALASHSRVVIFCLFFFLLRRTRLFFVFLLPLPCRVLFWVFCYRHCACDTLSGGSLPILFFFQRSFLFCVLSWLLILFFFFLRGCVSAFYGERKGAGWWGEEGEEEKHPCFCFPSPS
jgi:hypothetical protein